MLKSLELQKKGKTSSLALNTEFGSLNNVGFGFLITFILIFLFLLMESSALLWFIASGGLLLWSLWAIKQPVYAFSTLLFVWITVYSRTTIPFFQIEGPGNRGGIALGDLLWLAFTVVMLLNILLRKGGLFPKKLRVSMYVLLMLPYIVLTFLLPFLGVTFKGWPLSYGLPGIRALQWASFSIFSYWLARQYNIKTLINSMIGSVVLATVFHMIYSGLQILTSMKIFPLSYLFLDQLFSRRFTETWFFYPRSTGLLVNPNSYGLFGALVFVIYTSIIISGIKLSARYKIILMTGAIWSILISGSRSAVVGVGMALSILYFSLIGNAGLKRGTILLLGRGLRFGLVLLFVLTPLVALAFIGLPDVLRERLLRLTGIFSQGLESDPNAIGRTEMWSEVIEEYWLNYPFGTWVPPSYALWSAVDSYYVVTLTQGTPIFLFAFLIFLFGVMLLGFNLLNRLFVESKWVGLTLLGYGGVIAGASFTLSPLLQPQIISLFWSHLGLALAIRKR